jgi:hypothetical protein
MRNLPLVVVASVVLLAGCTFDDHKQPNVSTNGEAARTRSNVPSILRTLDPRRNTGDDRTGWAYEGFFFEALDSADGQPFLIVHNHWRGKHAGGGQWPSSPNLLPAPHG